MAWPTVPAPRLSGSMEAGVIPPLPHDSDTEPECTCSWGPGVYGAACTRLDPECHYHGDKGTMVVRWTLPNRRASREPNWYRLFKESGLALEETRGDGVGRFTEDDKIKIAYARASREDKS